MLKKILFLLLLSIFTMGAVYAERPHVNIAINPLAVWIPSDAKATATYRYTYTSSYYRYTYTSSESMEITSMWAPNIEVGIDFDKRNSGFGIEGHYNYIYASEDEDFTGHVLGLRVVYIFPRSAKRIFMAKLKAGVLSGFDFEYSGWIFDDASGSEFGASLHVGKIVNFHAEILYRSLELPIENNRYGVGFDVGDLDLSGLVINLGIVFNF